MRVKNLVINSKYCKALFLTCFLFAFYSIYAQDYMDDPSKLLGKSSAQRTIMLTNFYEESLRFNDSIQIFTTINKIKSLANENNDEDLTLEAALMELHYYTYRNYFEKKFVVEKITNLYELAKAKEILWLEIRTQSLLANYFYSHHKEYGQGFEHYENTAQLLKNVSIDEFPLKQTCLFQIGIVYSEFKEYDTSNRYLLQAKNLTPKYDNNYYNPHIYNTLGDNYANLRRLDSSNFYFSLNLKRAVQAKDSIWIGISSGNLGTNALLEHDYDRAIPLLESSIEIMKKAEDWSFTSGRYTDLGFAFLALNQLNKSKEARVLATEYQKKSKDYKRQLNLFKFNSKLAAYESKPVVSAAYLDSTFTVKDSLDKMFNSTKLLRAQQRIEIEKKNRLAEITNRKNKERLWFRNGIILFLTFFIVLVGLIYNRRILRGKIKEKQMAAANALALQKLESATENLNLFKQSILTKNKIIEQFETRIDAMVSPTSTAETQKKLEKTALLTDKDWRNFVMLFEQVHQGFFEQLKGRYPNLTPSEIRLMALSRLELGTKEMALMLGVGTDAIRQTKSRLKRKLQLNKELTFHELAKSI